MTFWWGTAASATQAEGAADGSDWHRWERLGRAPESGDGNGFATRYPEDFSLFADHGLTQHRLSIEWARIEPREGHRDPAAIEHYREMLRTARDAGIDVWACLHHFSLPGWFADDMGGFLDERGRGLCWPRHVDFVAETFGDLVAGWQPMNEPMAYAGLGYLAGVMPPGTRDLATFNDALRSVLLANVDAARLLRDGTRPVSTIMNLSPLMARATSDEPGAHERAKDAHALLDRAMWGWTSLLREGVLRLPFGAEEEVPHATEAFDLAGFSYYFAMTVDEESRLGPYPVDGEVGPLGFVAWPRGLGLVLERLAEELPDTPLLIAELGIGTRADDGGADEKRLAFMRAAIDELHTAQRAGIDVRGLFWWTGVDNYEWIHGFDARFGLFDRDRTPSMGAAFAKELALSPEPGTAPSP